MKVAATINRAFKELERAADIAAEAPSIYLIRNSWLIAARSEPGPAAGPGRGRVLNISTGSEAQSCRTAQIILSLLFCVLCAFLRLFS